MLQPDLPAIIPRRRAAVLAEEAVEIGGVAKAEAVADLLDGKIELLQPRAGFANQPLVDDRARRQLLVLTRKITGKVKLSPSSARASRMTGPIFSPTSNSSR